MNGRLFGAVVACALAAATSSLALPHPRYPVASASKSKHDKHKDDAKPSKGTYVVPHGDTVSSIARKLGVSQKDLKDANDLHGPLKPGQKLHVPHAKAHDEEDADASPHGKKDAKGARAEKTYTVAHGDTLSGIARKLGVSSRDLAEANDIHGPLKRGMKLHVPGKGETREAASDDRPAHGKHADAAPSTYTVARGDTLAGLAKRLGVSSRELADANGLHGPLKRGMKLRVPLKGEAREQAGDERPAKHAATPATYTVARGDTLAGVAKRLHVSSQALADANHLHGTALRRGMKLHVPGSEEAPAESARADRSAPQPAQGGGTYTVARGDTLTGVTRRFRITARELRAANDLAPDEPIDRGMKLKLPVSAHDHGRDAHASGVLVAPKLRVAAAKPAPVTPPADDTGAADETPTRVADATPSHPVVVTPPPAPHDYTIARPDHGAGAVPQPRSSGSAVVSGDTEGPPPMPGSPTFRAANDHAAVTSIHPPVVHGFPSSSELASLGKGRFIWPVKGEVVTRFGDVGHDLKNDGLNIEAALGASVRSAADGQVVYAGDSVPGFGNMVLVKHADGWITAYGHLSRIGVKISQRVAQGEEIGQVGQSGGVDHPQLHFEVRYAPPSSREKARPVDPSMLLP
ncbi:MAG TPA: LysM peptidoglycan-binding domain-containing protein [Caulobacteraceae bacterium]|jgi:murein DD-endopeptidase MepM/ murein hydrolase activator NlpD